MADSVGCSPAGNAAFNNSLNATNSGRPAGHNFGDNPLAASSSSIGLVPASNCGAKTLLAPDILPMDAQGSNNLSFATLSENLI